MTSSDSAHCQPPAAQCAVRLHRSECVGRAGRVVPAGLTVERADHQAPCLQDEHEHRLHRCAPARDTARANAASRSPASAALGAAAADGRARTTTRDPAGSSSIRSRSRCRRRRRTVLRTTADPTARSTTRPTRTGPVQSVPGVRCTTTRGRPTRNPCLTVLRNSRLRRSRWVAGSTPTPLGSQTGSGREPSTALATARCYDRTACAGPHAQPETMLPRPATVVRLEGALHGAGSRCLGGQSVTNRRSPRRARTGRTAIHVASSDRSTVRGQRSQGQTHSLIFRWAAHT